MFEDPTRAVDELEGRREPCPAATDAR